MLKELFLKKERLVNLTYFLKNERVFNKPSRERNDYDDTLKRKQRRNQWSLLSSLKTISRTIHVRDPNQRRVLFSNITGRCISFYKSQVEILVLQEKVWRKWTIQRRGVLHIPWIERKWNKPLSSLDRNDWILCETWGVERIHQTKLAKEIVVDFRESEKVFYNFDKFHQRNSLSKEIIFKIQRFTKFSVNNNWKLIPGRVNHKTNSITIFLEFGSLIIHEEATTGLRSTMLNKVSGPTRLVRFFEQRHLLHPVVLKVLDQVPSYLTNWSNKPIVLSPGLSKAIVLKNDQLSF